MDRKIDIEYNKFPQPPSKFLLDLNSQEYKKSLELNLIKLSNYYKIEEYDDYSQSVCYTEYSALRYLLSNTDLFIFQGKQPGKGKDSRKENSRVIGQTLCRYFNTDFLEAPFMANVSDFLNKKLRGEFDNIRLVRATSGDTPDFICAKSDGTIFLSEAKGRRKIVSFRSTKFDKWREQFKRISVLKSNNPIAVKGYIFEVAIANQGNKISNSRILVEDPQTDGESSEFGDDFINLVKCGHYKRLLQKLQFSFVGNALLYPQKLPSNKFHLPVYSSKVNGKEYLSLSEYSLPHLRRHFGFESLLGINQIARSFVGIEKSIFQKLMIVARGDMSAITSILDAGKEDFSSESHAEFLDGTLICNQFLVSFKDIESF